MEKSLEDYLLQNGLSDETIRVLQQEQLIDVSLLEEIDVGTLVSVCGFTVGQALTIKRHAKGFAAAENKEVDSCTKVPNVASETTNEHANNVSECNQVTSPFTFEEKKNRMLFRDFKLPEQFSPSVTLALENKALEGNTRHEFIRDVCSHISSHGVYYLNKTERHQVAAAIVSKYPFLKDAIGSGLGSWDESIKNRFKHVRKYDAKKRKISFQDTANESSPITKEVTKPKRIKRVDFWNDIPTISKEKESVIGEHLVELSKECSLPTKNQNIGKINQLMISSFEFRRIEILTKLIPVKDLVQKYPPLKKVSGIRQEFCRVIKDENAVHDIKERFLKYSGAVTKYCKEQSRKPAFIKNMLCFLQEAIAKKEAPIESLEAAFALIALPELLRQKNKKSTCDVIKVISEDEDISSIIAAVTFPTVLRVGENPLIPTKTVVCVEGLELVNVSSLSGESILFILYSLYYIFSISFPNEQKDFFLFLDSVIVGLSCVQTRISIQQLTKELQKFI